MEDNVAIFFMYVAVFLFLGVLPPLFSAFLFHALLRIRFSGRTLFFLHPLKKLLQLPVTLFFYVLLFEIAQNTIPWSVVNLTIFWANILRPACNLFLFSVVWIALIRLVSFSEKCMKLVLEHIELDTNTTSGILEFTLYVSSIVKVMITLFVLSSANESVFCDPKLQNNTCILSSIVTLITNVNTITVTLTLAFVPPIRNIVAGLMVYSDGTFELGSLITILGSSIQGTMLVDTICLRFTKFRIAEGYSMIIPNAKFYSIPIEVVNNRVNNDRCLCFSFPYKTGKKGIHTFLKRFIDYCNNRYIGKTSVDVVHGVHNCNKVAEFNVVLSFPACYTRHEMCSFQTEFLLNTLSFIENVI